MTQPTQRQVDTDIEQSKDLFERADVGAPRAIAGRAPKRMLVALDGSTQDQALLFLAKRLHDRTACRVGFLACPPAGHQIDPRNLQALEELAADRVDVAADLENNYDQILAGSTEFNADLLMAPCPFGRDFQSIGEDSTGTVIDVLIARSRIPFVAIRHPDATGRDPTSHLRLILTGENPAADIAAQWAVGLVHPQGRLELLLLVEQSFYEDFREALHSIQPQVQVTYEDLENALAQSYARLHAALQHAASSIGFTYELLIRHEVDDQSNTPNDPLPHPVLIVLALERSDHNSQSEVHNFIRRSPHSVLVASVE